MTKQYPDHVVIPDTQVKEGVPLEHLSWAGQYIVDKKPTAIVIIGDFSDLPSLSSYDRGKKSFEGRRYKKDIAAAKKGMEMLLAPMREYNEKAKKNKDRQYKPTMILTLGNHEQRIQRVIEDNAELDGVVSYDDLPYEDWQVIDFLDVIELDGVLYTHYLANPMTGKPYGGTALSQLAKVGRSFVVGHKQTLDVATRFTLAGQQQWGIINGAFYQHHEDYKGPQGNHHYRGIMHLRRVVDGSFDPTFISIDYLRDKYA